MRHVITAGNLAVRALTNLTEKEAGSPRLIQQTLERFDEPQAKEFANFYMNIWKTASKQAPNPAEIRTQIRKIRDFIEWVKKQSPKKDDKDEQ